MTPSHAPTIPRDNDAATPSPRSSSVQLLRVDSDTEPSMTVSMPPDDSEQPDAGDDTRRGSLTPKAAAIRLSSDAGTPTTAPGSGTPSESRHGTAEARFGNDGVGARRSEDKAKATSEELRLERLREAVLLSQQRARLGVGKQMQNPNSLAQRRVSPIKEESSNTMSPTLDEAFASPLATGTHSVSTESSGSVQTVKGSVPPTPGAGALRTPSYPFPLVAGTPTAWSPSLHRPFTTLSPTVSAQNIRDALTPHEGPMSSGTSTPAGSTATFMPGAAHALEDVGQTERYPSPSLYDLVLALNCEPGLNAWWSVVVNVLRDWYGAERATLAVPADASELETVPWGQKATYNVTGCLEVPRIAKEEPKQSAHPSAALRKVQDDTEKSVPRRPRFSARHSYAGFEGDRNAQTTPLATPSSARLQRPRGPMRTASHAPFAAHQLELPLPDAGPPGLPPPHPLRQIQSTGGASDPSLPSVGPTEQAGPYEAVFPSLRALDTEPNSLLDSAGVFKVLERGRLVTLTRDYAISSSSRAPSAEPSSDDDRATQHRKPTSKAFENQKPKRLPKADRKPSDYFSQARLPSTYEEYEQYPLSPWSQSPAPSPAIQADPEENPFFASPKLDEDTFNPEGPSPNYAKYTQVPAIGIDRASTITHVPLIHPILSQVLPPLSEQTRDSSPSLLRRASTSESLPNPADPYRQEERRAPIAVISFLSQTVPYPHNLTQSLKLLAPHLATTFANANQHTNALKQAVSIRNRRLPAGSRAGLASFVSEPENLEDLLRLDIDDINASVSGSMTSPSDYSAQSRFSPGGSLQETPGWDPGSIGFTRSVNNTPAHLPGVDFIDNYFEVKKRSSSASKEPVAAQTRTPRRQQVTDTKKRSLQIAQAPRPDTSPKDELSPESSSRVLSKSSRRRSSSPSHRKGAASPPRSNSKNRRVRANDSRQHTQLHSFGADFKSSFSTLEATASPFVTQPTDDLSHGRSNSLEVHDMLPPSEKLLRIIVDALPVQIFMATPSDGSITWANAKYLAYRGQDSRQIMQDPWHSIHGDDWDEFMESWKRCLSTGMQLSHKVRLQRFDGQYRWFFVKIAPLKDKRQNIVHWVGTNMDFHEQHVAETNAARQQETAASEAKYRALANSSPQIVFAATKEKGVTFCNSQWTNYSGQTEEEARGVGFMDRVHPEDLDKCRLPSFKADGTPTEVPVTVDARSRTRSDMTRVASMSEESLGDSYDRSPSVASPALASPTVTSPNIDETAHPSEVHRLPQAKLSKLASTGILKAARDAEGRLSYSTEVRLRNKDDNYRWHLVRVLRSELKDLNDDEQTWYGTCTDINDHKLLEQTLKETMDAKSRFLSNMSHEIRTPLNGITGMVNFLIDSNLTAEQMEHVNIIRNSTEGLRDLINDILDLSKVEAGMITLTRDWLHVRSLIEEVNDLTSALAMDKGLELNYIVEESVPRMVRGDRFRIRQVLLNVVGNAIKFTQRGEVFVRCQRLELDSASPASTEAMVQFEVIDTGSGFTEKEAEYLFKRFSQIDGSSTRQHGGTGLGLAISMQLVELHGGTMKATSVPGQGSTFTFTIKFELPSDSDRPPPPPMTPGIVATPSAESGPLSSKPLEGDGGRTSNRLEDLTQSALQTDTLQLTAQLPHPTNRPEPLWNQSFRSSPVNPVFSNSSGGLRPLVAPGAATAASKRSLANPAASVPLLSVLVVCSLQWSRLATVKHIEMTLPQGVPHNIAARDNIQDSLSLLQGNDAVHFTHVVLSVKDADEVLPFMNVLLAGKGAPADELKSKDSAIRTRTSLVVVSDLTQRRQLTQRAPGYDYEGLQRDRLLRFIYKPLKPSKLAVIFDPQRERDVSSDLALEGAQAVAVNQKQVFDRMKLRLSAKNIKVLLVEDNKTNQMVLLKFLKRADIQAQAVMDGEQCTDEVFKKPWGTYSIILCDLHMPNKDGYQTCKDIRKWERKNKYPHLPIVALSANVLGDVYAKCVDAGFNGYVTKPVDFKELSEVMMAFLDPAEPGKPHAFMKMKDNKKR